MNIEEILKRIYTSDLLSSEELHELTEWICDKDEEIERLDNIINEIDMMLKTLIMDSDFSNTKLTAQVILINLNKLRGFNKGDDKE